MWRRLSRSAAVRPARRRALASQPASQQLLEIRRAAVAHDEGRHADALAELDRARDILHALPPAHELRQEVGARVALARHCMGDYAGERAAWAEVAGSVAACASGLSALRVGAYAAATEDLALGMADARRTSDAAGLVRLGAVTAYALHLEAADMADEVVTTTLREAGEAPDGAVAQDDVGDLLLLRAMEADRRGEEEAARTLLTKALRHGEKAGGMAPVGPLAKLAELDARAGRQDDAEANASRALAIVGSNETPHSARLLRPLARMYGRIGEPVLAEGLYRSACDALRAAAEHAPGCDTAQTAEELAETLEEFAELLARTEWNGKPRTGEAAVCRDDAAEALDRFPKLAEQAAAPGRWGRWFAERYYQNVV